MDYVVVVKGLVSRDGITARVSQVDSGGVEGWELRSARCHVRLANWFGKPRLGEAVAYMLGLQHPLVVTRRGNRVTICEVDTDGILMVHTDDQVSIPIGRTQALHDAILSGLDGDIQSSTLKYRLV